jgi:hypothetical protein
MVMEAMINNSADGIAMLEAHEDAEVVRLRLGKALDFEYSEDSFAGLFQRRDPREAGPILDIERALSKLEKVRGVKKLSTRTWTNLKRFFEKTR